MPDQGLNARQSRVVVNAMQQLVKLKVQVASVLLLLVSVGASANTYYFHNDHLGTPQVLTDEDQNVVWQGRYDPFGKVEETVALVEQNLRFPGQYLDRETGQHYNYFRDYDPTTGRYVESDPIGLEGGINTYSYVSANPLIFIDPDGLERHSVGLGGSIPMLGGIDINLFATDGEGDQNCLADIGISFDLSSPIDGPVHEKGVGKMKVGTQIGYEPNGGRGDVRSVDAEIMVGAGGVGGKITGVYTGNYGYVIEGGVVAAFGANKTVSFSLSIGDLARLTAAIVNWDFSHRIFGATSGSSCECK